MNTKSFNSIESTFLSKLNEGYNTFDKLINVVPYNETTLKNTIESLITKNIIKFDNIRKEYCYDTIVEGQIVVLDGNIMLPVTIIETKDKILVTRGEWYEFPKDFDIRRIVWNVQIPSKNKSSLIELIQSSILKERKTKIIQLPEYINLQNKLVPWSSNIKLKLNVIGEEITDVNIIFIEKIGDDELIEFREFTVKSEISTTELISELTKSVEERNFQNIKLNRIYNFSDFVFSGNCIPYLFDTESICYGKITGVKGKFEITYFRLDDSGKIEKLNVEEYFDATEGIEKIRELFVSYGEILISKNNFLVETTE